MACKWNDAIKSERCNSEILYLMMEASFCPFMSLKVHTQREESLPISSSCPSVELEIDGKSGREEERIGSKGYRRTGQQIDVLKTASWHSSPRKTPSDKWRHKVRVTEAGCTPTATTRIFSTWGTTARYSTRRVTWRPWTRGTGAACHSTWTTRDHS